MHIEFIRIALQFWTNQFTGLFTIRFYQSLAGRHKNTFDNKGLSLDYLQWVYDILPVLNFDEPAAFSKYFHIGPIKFLNGKCLRIIKNPFISRINFIDDKVGLRRPQPQTGAMLFPIISVYLESLPYEGTINFWKICKITIFNNIHIHSRGYVTIYYLTSILLITLFPLCSRTMSVYPGSIGQRTSDGSDPS